MRLKRLEHEWQDTWKLANNNNNKWLFHSHIVAEQVIRYKETGVVPISFDTFAKDLSGIDGHHRLKALEYMKIPYIPMSLSGDLDSLSLLNPEKWTYTEV